MNVSVKPEKDGPSRLLRFVPSVEMPSPDTLTIFIAEHNLLLINKDLYDTLDPRHQRMAKRSTTTLVVT